MAVMINKGEVVSSVSVSGGASEPIIDLLWENSNPFVSFPVTTIQFNDENINYDYFVIRTHCRIQEPDIDSYFCRGKDIFSKEEWLDSTKELYITSFGYRKLSERTLNGVKINEAANTQWSSDNSICIPYKIFGVRFE